MSIYNNKNNIFFKLKKSCNKEWVDYTEHKFLNDLVLNKLSKSSFKKYLVQDYLFLHEFLKILALSTYKSNDYTHMNRSINYMTAIREELKLHIKFCKKWKISLNKLKKVKHLKSNRAYTDYVLRIGSMGSNLDLFTCLAPCIIGYGEIGFRLSKFKNSKKSKYSEWIKMYSSKEYQLVAKDNIDYLDQLFKTNKKNNFKKLLNYFRKATILEKNFWDMI